MDFEQIAEDFLQEIASNWQRAPQGEEGEIETQTPLEHLSLAMTPPMMWHNTRETEIHHPRNEECQTPLEQDK